MISFIPYLFHGLVMVVFMAAMIRIIMPVAMFCHFCFVAVVRIRVCLVGVAMVMQMRMRVRMLMTVAM